jgi:hypothetical protein
MPPAGLGGLVPCWAWLSAFLGLAASSWLLDGLGGLGGLGPQNAVHISKGYAPGYAPVCVKSPCHLTPGLAGWPRLAWLAGLSDWLASPGLAGLPDWLASPGLACWAACKALQKLTYYAKHQYANSENDASYFNKHHKNYYEIMTKKMCV